MKIRRPEPYVEKYTDDKWAVGFIYYPPDLNEGETITACTAVITGFDSQLTVVGDTIIDNDNKTATAVITGGTSGKVYTVTFKTTTSVSYIFVDVIKVRIK